MSDDYDPRLLKAHKITRQELTEDADGMPLGVESVETVLSPTGPGEVLDISDQVPDFNDVPDVHDVARDFWASQRRSEDPNGNGGGDDTGA
ncbi:hypothetical protein [Mycobacteroides abscessus]|uniref:hypothetical protein n=1 Tax=Mycobacteroides abscessus TaxID=36809 RepID=UPI000C263D7D|nr:hypothetical protein [Mycobacteroides abscessus]